MIFLHITIATITCFFMLASFLIGLVYLMQESQLRSKRVGFLFWKLPSLVASEKKTFLCLEWGFFLLSATLLTGGWILWQFSHAYDFIFHWHIILALVGWSLYGYVLFKHLKRNCQGRKIVLLSLVGFAVLLLAFMKA